VRAGGGGICVVVDAEEAGREAAGRVEMRLLHCD
jgi:hypothetical protein